MPLQQYFLDLLTTTLLVTLTSQSSFAFSITPDQTGRIKDSDGTYKYSERYDTGQGITRLDAWPVIDPRRLLQGQVLAINPGGTDDLLNQLNTRFGRTWDFEPSGDLQGSFNIENYFACGANFNCTDGTTTGPIASGAFFKLNYNPAPTDPQGSTVHWIQRAISNFDIQDGNVVNDQIPIDRLDILPNAGSPYYDESYPISGSNSTLFFDLPNVQAPFTRKNHYFYAETYLVNEVPGGTTDPDTGIVKRKVEIYSGVRWGWENEYTPGGYYTDIISDGIGSSPSGYEPNDDGSFGPYPLGFPFTYFGKTYNDFYINNNGNISFGQGINAYTPTSLITESIAPIIAPYWADVDTRGTGTVTMQTNIPNQVTVTWDKVGYFSQHTDKTASFQLVLRGPDYPIPADQGNVGFFYKDVSWETGDASDGSGGFGGTQAGIGFGDGSSTVNPGEFSLSGSQQAGISNCVSNSSIWFNVSSQAIALGDEGCGSDGGGGSLGSSGTNRYLLPSGIDSGKNYQLSKSVSAKPIPEPTTALGLLALGVSGILRRRIFDRNYFLEVRL